MYFGELLDPPASIHVIRILSRITVKIEDMYSVILKDLGVISPRAETTIAAAIVTAVDTTRPVIR
jgi:hypothetical protein